MLKLLAESASDTDCSDTALGDWYLNRIVVDRQPLLLLVSSESRLAMLTPARDVRNLPQRIGNLVAARLRRLGIDERVIGVEVAAMADARVGRTRDRSVTGQMVNFAKAIPYYLPANGWDGSDLQLAEDRLGDTPCLAGRSLAQTIFPDQTATRLLHDRWEKHTTLH